MSNPRYQQRIEEIRGILLQIAEENASSMKYYKRRWDEGRGDEYEKWGRSIWYFEVAPNGTVIRQMEIYDTGAVLQYHANRLEDTYGGLSDQPLDHSEYVKFAVTRDEFEMAWKSHPPLNWQ